MFSGCLQHPIDTILRPATTKWEMAIYLVTARFRAAKWPWATLGNGLLTIIDEFQDIHGVDYGDGFSKMFVGER